MKPSASMSFASASMSMSAASGSFVKLPPPEPTGPFSKRMLWVIVPVAVLSLVVAGVLTLFGDDLKPTESTGPDAYSQSAIGHRGLVHLLEKLDVPVIVSRGASAMKAKDGLLVIAEPSAADSQSRARLEQLLADGHRVLLVLPKWYGIADRGKSWIESANLVPASDVDHVLEAAGLDAHVDREAPSSKSPAIHDPQIVVGTDLEPEFSHGAGMLVGLRERDDKVLYVLSDPDVLNNAGLRDPHNAKFTVDLIDRLRAGGPVIIDETVHGQSAAPGLMHALFSFPLVLATIQVLICALIAMWAALVRFGPKKVAPPPIAPGKDFLIRNTAALLRYGGHHAHALRRYLDVAVRDVRRTLHAPEAKSPAESTAWLERVRNARGGKISLAELEEDVAAALADSPTKLVALADLVYRWRQEMLHGTRQGS